MLGITFVAATKQQKGGMNQQCLAEPSAGATEHFLTQKGDTVGRATAQCFQTFMGNPFQDVADCTVFQLLNDPAKLSGMGAVSI